ncbi:MAG: family 78 glycoside hydrolase catalytic domain [Anaerolinea sp.]|nr:family 78 glycoside hydrolase catalytic domain [Anaerolinea sp.]
MLQVLDLRCEFARNPLGIDARQPRFSWVLEHAERGQAQTAYQIIVASSLEKLAAEQGDLWDSGKTSSSVHPLIEYAGVPLISRRRAYWKVRAWDRQNRVSAFSDAAWFEMGLLEAADWRAAWIGFPAGWNGKALYFRDKFTVQQPIISARAYVASPNWIELHVNGSKVGDRVLEPAQTDAGRRVLYTTYDVTGHLRAGDNVIGAIVGNGWYGTPKLLVQLEIRLTDGTMQQVISGKWNAGGSWWRVADGAVRENGVYDGETYDARLERPGWDTPDNFGELFPNRDNWAGAMATEPPGGRLVAAALEPVKVIETRRAVTLTQPMPGVFVFDIGQNLAGWARITVQGIRDTIVTLQFAEAVYPDGTVNTENLRAARARDTYIVKGGSVESWEPRFTYHGFRYIQVEGFPGEPTLESLEIRVVRSAVEPTGEFECDHPLINRIHRVVWWTEASNLHGVPTDCPQRDERMGWLNDMAARTEEALYNFDLARLLPKWLNDIADAQDDAGALADTAPFRWGSRPGDPVEVCYLLIPLLLYSHYGDRRVLEDHYEGMRRWVDYLASRSQDYIVSYGHIGDWAPPLSEALAGSIGSSAVARNTPTPLVSTAFFAYAAALFARAAHLLEHSDDEQVYRQLFTDISSAFNRHFWDEERGGYGSNNQACNTLALYMGLTPENRRDRVIANLIRDIKEHEDHLTTGNLCTKYIFEVLTDAGCGDAAFRLATQTSYPSWGFMLDNGATTIWERWEQATGRGMNSHNHPMYGSIDAWFYRALAGIRINPASPGCASLTLTPPVSDRLKHVRASVKTVRGVIDCVWEREGDNLHLRVHIPVGTEASIIFPDLGGGARLLEGEIGVIWEAGAASGNGAGIVAISAREPTITVIAGSGSYHFTAERTGA